VFEDGVVTEILVEPGREVPVGEVLARIDGGVTKGPPPEEAQKGPTTRERVRATPAARRLAEELGVALATVRGTGPEGALTLEDVERAAPTKKIEPQKIVEPAGKPAEGMRLAIAAAMARSNREIPHYYLETRIDMKRALAYLAEKNAALRLEERILPAVLLLKSVALALREVPELNGYWVDDALQKKEQIHVGFAISLRNGGLVTPALHDVDRKSLSELMGALRDLVPRARAGRLRSSELGDATVTVTNLGDLGVETVYGVIYPPQVALVGFGKIVEQPWAENGMIGVHPVLSATLAADHRATDGARGAVFLDSLARRLKEPEKL
jgi:pyruvate dehydrogenase E2 component (dihydrolipoamide acetyltransferase)